MAELVCATCFLIVARTYLVDKQINNVDYVPAFSVSMVGLYQNYPLGIASVESEGDWGIRVNGTEALGGGSGLFKFNIGLTKPNYAQNGQILVEVKGNVKINDFHLASQCVGCPQAQSADSERKSQDK